MRKKIITYIASALFPIGLSLILRNNTSFDLIWKGFVLICSCSFFILLNMFFLKMYFTKKNKPKYIQHWILLSLGLFVAVSGVWIPGIVWESMIYEELQDKCLSPGVIGQQIARIDSLTNQGNLTDLKEKLENIELLKELPYFLDSKDSIIVYGYSKYDRQVGKERWKRSLFILSIALLNCLIILRYVFIQEWDSKKRIIHIGLLAILILGISGLLPLIISGGKLYLIAYMGFYTALFCWCLDVKSYEMRTKFRITGSVVGSANKAEAINKFYMRVIGLAFTIFGIVTIGLVWNISQYLSSTRSLSNTLSNYHLTMLIIHDVYGTLVLWLGVVLLLESDIVKTTKLYPSDKKIRQRHVRMRR